jgi:hypothetical protein
VLVRLLWPRCATSSRRRRGDRRRLPPPPPPRPPPARTPTQACDPCTCRTSSRP